MTIYAVLVAAVAVWAHAAWLYRAARRWDREAQAKLNDSASRLYQAKAVEHRLDDHKRVVAELKHEANRNRWRNAVIGGAR